MGSGCLRDHVDAHGDEVLVRLLDHPRGAEQRSDDDDAQHHGEQLCLEDAEFEALDDDLGEGSEPGSGERGADGDEAVAPGLRVEEGFLHLVPAELAVLESRLVGADALDHEFLVLFGPTFCAHGGVWRRVSHGCA